MKKKASLNISLETLVGIIIAVIAIVFIYSIISSLILTFTKEDRLQMDNFYNLRNLLENQQTDVNFFGFVKKDYVILGFNKYQRTLTGECQNYWFGTKLLSTKVKSADFSIRRDYLKCPLEFPCICLCKLELNSHTADCFDHGICLPLTSENTKDIKFSGFKGKKGKYKEESCNIPLIYTGGDYVVNYCLVESDDKIIFEPGDCES
ncbi:MAG: hypothetical protein ACLFPJ_00890 [Candidatus Woesearchaeota archaeon]